MPPRTPDGLDTIWSWCRVGMGPVAAQRTGGTSVRSYRTTVQRPPAWGGVCAAGDEPSGQSHGLTFTSGVFVRVLTASSYEVLPSVDKFVAYRPSKVLLTTRPTTSS